MCFTLSGRTFIIQLLLFYSILLFSLMFRLFNCVLFYSSFYVLFIFPVCCSIISFFIILYCSFLDLILFIFFLYASQSFFYIYNFLKIFPLQKKSFIIINNRLISFHKYSIHPRKINI